MPKKDLNSFGGLLGDLWQELSFIVRAFLFLGLAAGLTVMVLWIISINSDASVRLVGRSIIALGFGFVALGGVAGLVVGVIVESTINRFRSRKNSRRKGRS